MGETIRQKADRVGTFRFISVYLMETLARWMPTTPELEAKVFFGRQVWDFAQHADGLGRRTGELRSPMQWSLHRPTATCGVLQTMAGATGTMERLAGFHDGLLPDLDEPATATTSPDRSAERRADGAHPGADPVRLRAAPRRPRRLPRQAARPDAHRRRLARVDRRAGPGRDRLRQQPLPRPARRPSVLMSTAADAPRR